MALRIQYRDFVLIHDADIYAHNQQRILESNRDEIIADVYYANHHFHGSVLPEYILQVEPDLVILQAQEAIYARAAYMVNYLEKTETVLNKRIDKPVETLTPLEVGAIIVRVNDKSNWNYETFPQSGNFMVFGL